MSQPLRGALVIEAVSPRCPVALRLAIAFAGRLAADLGAQVVTVIDGADTEHRQHADAADAVVAAQGFLDLGKERVELPDGYEGPTWRHLHRQALATIEDQHLEATSTRTHRPPLQVVLSMFGQGIPASTPASEFTVMAMGGLLDLVGDPDLQPLMLGGHQLAYSAGLAAFTGLMAVLGPAQTAPAQDIVRVNLLDTAVWLNWKSLVSAAQSGVSPTRAGNRSEWRVVPCADGWVALVYRDADWARLKRLIDDSRLDAEEFGSQAKRREHAAALDAIMQSALLKLHRRDIHRAALAHRIPLGPVYSPRELMTDRQNVARTFLRSVSVDSHRNILIPRLPVLWNGRAVGPGAMSAAKGPEAVVNPR